MVAHTYFLYLIIPFWILLAKEPDRIFFQSDNLRVLKFESLAGQYAILDDNGEKISLIGLKDRDGILYWHRKLRTPVCLTGECKLIDIGIYWYCNGDFLGLEIYGEHLTKTDHSDFSAEDYYRLMEVLKNDWSKLREYELSDLVEEAHVETPGVDGTSGATKMEIAAEAVKDAVYTTHTIWHLIHVGEKEQLINLTARELNEGKILIEDLLFKDYLNYYRLFILKLIADGKLRAENWENSLIIESLELEDNQEIMGMAIKSLSRCNYFDSLFLQDLINIYEDLKTEEKIKFLSEFHNLKTIPAELFYEIVNQIDSQPDWYIIKVFQLFMDKEVFSKELECIAGNLERKDNALLEGILKKYRDLE